MVAGFGRAAVAVLVSAMAVTALGACGSTEPEIPDRLTACEVVTRSEVAAALGGQVEPPASAEAVTDTLAGRSGWRGHRSTANGPL